MPSLSDGGAVTPPLDLPLAELQRWMQAVVTSARPLDAALTTTDAEAVVSAGELARVIRPSHALDPVARLGIYHEMYRLRLSRAVADDHPALAHTLGEPAFTRLVADYVAATPSKSFTLNGYGAGLAGFVATWTEAPPDRRAWLADLARLERIISEVSDRREAPLLDEEQARALTAEDWERAQLVPIDALRVATFSFAVHDTWRSWLDDHPPADPQRRLTRLAIYRRAGAVRTLEVTREARDVLLGLAAGRTLGDVFDRLDRGHGEDRDPARVFRWLKTWVGAGLFARIDLAP